MRVQFVEVAGIRTRFLSEGNGEPVLLIHGLGTMAERWSENIDVLGRQFAVYAPDLATSGFSGDADLAGSSPQHVHLRQLEAFAEAIGLARYSVIGSSYGGLLASLLTVRNPKHINKLVIVGSGSSFHPAEEQREVLARAKQNAMVAFEDGTLDGIRRRFASIVHRKESVSEVAISMQATANAQFGRLAASRMLYDAMIEALSEPAAQIYPRLEDIHVPTLIVTGKNDPRASWERAVEARDRIPNARIELFDACGHGPMFEHPVHFNQLITAFLSEKVEPALELNR